jgi:hypothetical protein
MEAHRLAPLSTEFACSDLGDRRLTARLQQISDAAASKPGASIPGRSETLAQLEATYRFLENKAVQPEAILDAHVQCTVKRASRHDQVLVLHDTTEFKFDGEQEREGMGRLSSSSRRGFLGHFSFCVAVDGEPLGTLGLYAWTRSDTRKGRRPQQVSQYDPDRESLRWHDSAMMAGELLHGRANAIHVMDREGDSYELLAMLLEHEQRFVVRLSHDRRLGLGRAAQQVKLFDALSEAPFFFEREVLLSRRGKSKGSAQNHSHTARDVRIARLEVRGARKQIFLGNGGVSHVPKSLPLNFVEVREVEPPEGAEAVVWRLVTTEPIETQADVENVVDAYRGRWQIEEFFKAVKTGCRYQDRQLQSGHALLVDLAIETAVAWRLLLVRYLAQHVPTAPASSVLNETQLAVLQNDAETKGRPLPPHPTAKDILYAVAALAGHIKYKGPPGWLLLRAGFHELLVLERGWEAAQRYHRKM